ncbi:MAG: thiamine phosphate synthase [Clostridiaceae bacterium]|nr:thiamine phosphate synthase [Clostridiaceae bacterium]
MIYVVTNRNLVKHKNLLWVVEEALKGGADAIILREKDLSFEALLPIAKEIKQATEKARKLFIVNGNLQVAKAVDAGGYHSGFYDFVEKQPDYKGRLGVSIHSVEEAITAAEQGCDYILSGHVFPTDCKKGLEPRGINFIEAIKKAVDTPVVAIGGITIDNVHKVMKAGANGIAIMSSVMEAEDPAMFIQRLKEKMGSL